MHAGSFLKLMFLWGCCCAQGDAAQDDKVQGLAVASSHQVAFAEEPVGGSLDPAADVQKTAGSLLGTPGDLLNGFGDLVLVPKGLIRAYKGPIRSL